MPITVSYAVPGTSKRCSGMRLMLGFSVVAGGWFCCAAAGFVKTSTASAAHIADVNLSMRLLLRSDSGPLFAPTPDLSWTRAKSRYAAGELARRARSARKDGQHLQPGIQT